MNALFQLLSEQEIPALLAMMHTFYAQQHMRFDEAVAADVLRQLLDDPKQGQAYLVFRGSEPAGYFVLTFCFSLEFHGCFGLLDELYLHESHRGQKIGKAVVAFAEELCKKAGVHALRLEVGRDNQPAQVLYRAAGLNIEERFLMTKWL